MSKDNPTNRELHLILENLQDKIDTGFHGVHMRQDKINGQVQENAKFRIQAKASLSIFKWLFGFLGAGNVALIIKLFL